VNPVRSNADDPRPYTSGCVPHWAKGANVRKNDVLAHELCWAYYRVKRDQDHPHRVELGEGLTQENCPPSMRGGGFKFHFWRDLRPPFAVIKVTRLEAGGQHPQGVLHEIEYMCPIDFASERMWGEKSVGGTFDNMVHGKAQARIPEKFPEQRPMYVISWGTPSLNYSPEAVKDGSISVNPEKWMPIAEELGIRPDHPRFQGVRDAIRHASSKKNIQVPQIRKLLLSGNTTLPTLAKCETQRAKEMADKLRDVPPPENVKKRQHRIFSPAVGFVDYAG